MIATKIFTQEKNDLETTGEPYTLKGVRTVRWGTDKNLL